MLICEICSEETMTEDEMKTHLLLSHLENSPRCPFCCLAGVSYDELSFHIQSAHPEDQGDPARLGPGSGSGSSTDPARLAPGSGSSADPARLGPGSGPSAKTGERGKSRSDAAEAPPTAASSVRRSSTDPTQNQITQNPEPTPDSCWRDDPGGLQAGCSSNNVPSPSTRGKMLSCPMCSLVCSSSFILQEHVELHLQEQDSNPGPTLEAGSPARTSSSPSFSNQSGRSRAECPVCSLVCSDSFSLQQHVELHLDQSHGATAAGLGSDLRLARRLQQEDEARQETQHFKKLQRQFGLDGSGGYRRQMERNMEKAVASGRLEPAQFHSKRAEMMESLASGLDDGRTRTPGVMAALYDYYQAGSRDCVHVWLSAETDHYGSSPGDAGWGCGYRNFQMLLSSLQRTQTYSSVLTERTVPCLPELQRRIEQAWREGLDPQGAAQFNQRLQGTRAWIGATEIYVLLTWLGISARIIDFHQPTGAGDTHPLLFDWVKQYFSQSGRSSRLPPRVTQTGLPPLYLQHQGHSRSIVGVEQKKNGSLCLLLLDPGSSPSDGSDPVSIRRVRKFLRNLKHKQYQLVAVGGVLTPQDRQVRIQNSRTFCAERIP